MSYFFYFDLLLMVKLMSSITLSLTASPIKEYTTFTQTNSTILDDSPFRVAATNWSNVDDAVKCARKILRDCPVSKGFLFDSSSGLCTPLLWLHMGWNAASDSAPPGELYLTNPIHSVCPDGFQAAAYGDTGSMTCVTILSRLTYYPSAATLCSDLGGHLASIKTAEKLAVVAALAQGEDLWVGLSDLKREGEYVWEGDGQLLTTAEKSAVFIPGEPNNGWNKEDCVAYDSVRGSLKDVRCWSIMKPLCEIQPPPAEC